jgi:molybdopterin biosynthesis enzyme MoaB
MVPLHTPVLPGGVGGGGRDVNPQAVEEVTDWGIEEFSAVVKDNGGGRSTYR